MSAPRDAWWVDYRGDRVPWLGRSGWRVSCWQCGALAAPHLFVDWRSPMAELMRAAERAA